MNNNINTNDELKEEDNKNKIKNNINSKVNEGNFLSEKWEYIKKNIPALPLNLAVMIFISNLLFPPSGTFYLSIIGNGFRKPQLIVGLMQLISICFIIGWPWSIYWGYLTIKKSF